MMPLDYMISDEAYAAHAAFSGPHACRAAANTSLLAKEILIISSLRATRRAPWTAI